MTRVRGTIAAFVVALSALSLPADGLAVLAPGDHYMCYVMRLARGQVQPSASIGALQDQLGGPRPYDARRVFTICTPATKNGEAPQHPLVHELGMQLRSGNVPRYVRSDHMLFDQFGQQSLTLTGPVTLLDTSAKVLGGGGTPPLVSTQNVDRFSCYNARSTRGWPRFVPPPSPTVTDQFVTAQQFDLKKITRVCAPANVDGRTPGAETHPGHLVCYQAKFPIGTPRMTPIRISVNSTIMGPAVFDVVAPYELCVPAVKDANCDPLDPNSCMYPFPNDWFTVADPTTDTGRRVDFKLGGMPSTAAHTPITVTDYNLNDGFSPGASILLRVPGIDLAMTGAAPITNLARSLDADSPIVVVNASTLTHHLQWAEIDSNAGSEPQRSLIIRPAVNLDEGTRYIVALRQLKNSSGALLTPNADFLAYRDGTPTNNPIKEARRAHMESLFATLALAGVGRSDLYLAWDFTVASERNLSERLLFARDDAFARLGTAAPPFTVTLVENNVDSNIYRRVTGTYQVERYVNSTAPGARMVLGPNGLPLHQATPQTATFICNIPRAALPGATDPATPARASIYGHGLLGSASEVSSGNVKAMANEHNFVFCATNWIGMSSEDVPNAIAILQDLSKFPSLTDRLQQAMVNQLFLARLMIHAQGFVTDPAFQDSFGAPVIDRSDVFYDGNSQGGIFGGMVMAIAQDITRGVLGVPGMNYSLLLTRSTDFALYSTFLYPSYPEELTRPLLLALIQMLWNRSDPSGYAHHMTTNPLPNTPQHKVLLHVAFGDHQVANIATEIEARTIGASIHQPAIAGGRNPDVTPYYGIPAIPSYPFDGSALIIWDSGAAPQPTTNTAPSVGFDPHSDPRNSPFARQQKSDFLQTGGSVTDLCSGAPCTAPH